MDQRAYASFIVRALKSYLIVAVSEPPRLEVTVTVPGYATELSLNSYLPLLNVIWPKPTKRSHLLWRKGFVFILPLYVDRLRRSG